MGDGLDGTVVDLVLDVYQGRESLAGDDKKGFDMAVSMRIGQTTYPSSKAPPCTQAGYYIAKGIRGATPANQEAVLSTVAEVPEAKTGATIAVEQIQKANDSWWVKVRRFFGMHV